MPDLLSGQVATVVPPPRPVVAIVTPVSPAVAATPPAPPVAAVLPIPGPPGPPGAAGNDPQVLERAVAVVVEQHVIDPAPHPAYDDLPSYSLLFRNGLV